MDEKKAHNIFIFVMGTILIILFMVGVFNAKHQSDTLQIRQSRLNVPNEHGQAIDQSRGNPVDWMHNNPDKKVISISQTDRGYSYIVYEFKEKE